MGMFALQELQALLPILSKDHLISLTTEEPVKKNSDDLLVIDDQNFFHGAHSVREILVHFSKGSIIFRQVSLLVDWQQRPFELC